MVDYKNSGIEWIKNIPSHWDIKPNKYIMYKKKIIKPIYDNEDILSLTVNGVIKRDLDAGGKMPTSFNGYQKIEKNNLLMCLFDIDVTPRCIGYINDNGLTSPAYSQFVVKDDYYPKYFYYQYLMLDNDKTLLHLSKNLRHSLTEEQLGNVPMIVPPLEEQKVISRILDEKIKNIDEAVKDLEKEIELINEYKKIFITEIVSKGIEKKDLINSGIKYIPLVPKHWIIDKFKYHLKRKNVKNHPESEVLSLYREYGILPKNSRDDNYNVTSEDTSKYLFVKRNQFVVNKMKAWQGSVAVSNYEGIVSPAYYVYSFTDDLFDKKYFHYLLRSKCYPSEFRRLSGGIREGQWDLSENALNNIYILIPPKDEQKEIVAYLDNKIQEIEEIVVEKEKQISKLNDYKKSIIFEYITGKKVVNNV